MKMFSRKKSNKEEQVYNVVALGNTGVGKSSLLNMLANTEMFTVGEKACSQTRITVYNNETLTFMNEPDEIKLRLVDTQGIYDSSGEHTDNEHIKNMVSRIRELKHIDLFLLCVEETNPRFSGNVQETISLFNEIFPYFFEHVVLIFNRAMNPDPEKQDIIRKEYQDRFYKDYKKEHISCFFIDSFYKLRIKRYNNSTGKREECELHPDIQRITHDQVIKLKNYLISKHTRCDVVNVEPRVTQMTRLKEEIEALRQEIINMELKQKKLEKDMKKDKWKKVGFIAGGSSGGTIALGIIILVIFI